MMEKENRRVFLQFEESRIQFDPTYKYDIGTDTYDTRCVPVSARVCTRALCVCECMYVHACAHALVCARACSC